MICGFLDPADHGLLMASSFKEDGPTPLHFQGVTKDGWHVTAEGGMQESDRLPEDTDSHIAGAWIAFGVRRLRAERQVEMDVEQIRYGLTNLRMLGAKRWSGDGRRLALPLDLDAGTAGFRATLVRASDYDKRLSQLGMTKGVEVSCEVVFDGISGYPPEQLDEIVDDLSYVASVAAGTKVQWIYCDAYGASGERLKRTHGDRITKRYTPMTVIDYWAEGDSS